MKTKKKKKKKDKKYKILIKKIILSLIRKLHCNDWSFDQ